MRWFSNTVKIAFVLSMALVISIPCYGRADKAKKPLTIYFLDVGQGDSTLVVSPSGKTALIDGGMGGSGYKKKDKGKTVIIPLLKEKNIHRLDYMIMTHADFDHIGGLVYILDNTKPGSAYPLEIGEFLDPGQAHTTYLYQELLEAVKKRPKIKYRIAKKGEKLDLGEGITAEILSPERLYKDANNCSIVIKITDGQVSALLTGDAEIEAEKDMVKNFGAGLKSTLLKAGHHGSAKSSSADFLNMVKPEAVVISAGENNKFRLPFKEAMERLKKTKAKIYRTDYEGTITFTTNGETYDVKTEREAPPPDKRWDREVVLKEHDKINVNTATREQLISLPRIGKVKSEAIIKRRPYNSVDELRRVPGIGEKIMERIRPLVTVGGPRKASKAAPANAGQAKPAE